jgi:NADH-quinone oxidoreductase subunit L
MAYALIFGLFLPLIGFLILMLTAYVVPRLLAGLIGCGTVGVAFLCFATLLIIHHFTGAEPEHIMLFHWIPVERIQADFALHMDTLALLMTLIITGVGFLIHVYSMGYIEHEEDYARYFACMNFFVFAMLLLVLASNLLLLFVGWEGVGLASYLLIGY